MEIYHGDYEELYLRKEKIFYFLDPPYLKSPSQNCTVRKETYINFDHERFITI